MSVKIVCFLFFLLPVVASGQEYYLDNSVKVITNGEDIKNPWVSGVNSAHINDLDLDLDGDPDLILFEKSSSSVYTFIRNENNELIYSPEFINLIPKISGWFLTRDINNDGKKDIFTADPLGVRLYTNKLPLNFEQYAVAPLLTETPSGVSNIYVAKDDLPAIQDVDFDGDLDIINFKFSGTTLEWHKNLQVEENLTDTLKFKKVTDSYGEIRICGCSNFTSTENDCAPEGRQKHSQHHALLFLDVDGDNDLDLMFSDGECADLHVAKNTGTRKDPVFSKHRSSFKNYIPMRFPVPFLADTDNDNDQDLIVGTNSILENNTTIDFQNSVWLFENIGSNENPNYNLETKSFLQQEMIDEGQNSKAVLFDLDNDGDKDMIVGKYLSTRDDYLTGFSYYENTGSFDQPEFTFVTDDLFNTSNYLLYNLKPQFVDVTGDTKPDFVFSGSSLYNPDTRIYYFENTGKVKFNSNFELKELYPGLPFNGNFYIDDIYQDGQLDLLITLSGRVARFEREYVDFIVKDENFLSLPPSVHGLKIDDINGDFMKDLIFSQNGKIKVIYDYQQNTSVSDLILLDSEDSEISQSFGNRLQIETQKLLNNNIPELIISSNTGGVTVLKSREAYYDPVEDPLMFYPNPVIENNTLKLQSRRNLLLYILNSEGKILIGPTYLPSYELYDIAVDNLASGMYIIHVFVDEETSWQRKFVIIK